MPEDVVKNQSLSLKKRAAIHQPHYFPWIPYWNKIASVDVFIIFDTVQLPRGKSRVLRAKYLDHKGEKWLTIPFGQKAELLCIKDIKLEDLSWKKEHIEKLRNAYRKAPYADFALYIVDLCLKSSQSYFLLDIEYKILEIVARNLEIKTKFVLASDLIECRENSLQEYVVMLLESVKAEVYLSGKEEGSRKTIDDNLFNEKNIEIEYQDFLIQPYKQLYGNEFNSTVSMLDTLFMIGYEAKNHAYADFRK